MLQQSKTRGIPLIILRHNQATAPEIYCKLLKSIALPETLPSHADQSISLNLIRHLYRFCLPLQQRCSHDWIKLLGGNSMTVGRVSMLTRQESWAVSWKRTFTPSPFTLLDTSSWSHLFRHSVHIMFSRFLKMTILFCLQYCTFKTPVFPMIVYSRRIWMRCIAWSATPDRIYSSLHRIYWNHEVDATYWDIIRKNNN